MGVNVGVLPQRGTSGLAGVDERRPATGDSGTCGRQEASLNAAGLGTLEVLPDARLVGGLNRERGANREGCAVEAACGPVGAFGSSAGTAWLVVVVAFRMVATDRLEPWRNVRCAPLSGTVESLAGARAVVPTVPFTGWRLLLEAVLAPARGTTDLRGSSGTAGVACCRGAASADGAAHFWAG